MQFMIDLQNKRILNDPKNANNPIRIAGKISYKMLLKPFVTFRALQKPAW